MTQNPAARIRQILADAIAYEPQDVHDLGRKIIRELDPNKGVRGFVEDKSGTTALEYGLIAGVLGLVLIAIFHNFGAHLTTLFSTIGRSL